MKLLQPVVDKIKSAYNTIHWSIVISMIAAGVCCVVITGVIFLYLFAALAHVQSAYGYARAFLWKR